MHNPEALPAIIIEQVSASERIYHVSEQLRACAAEDRAESQRYADFVQTLEEKLKTVPVEEFKQWVVEEFSELRRDEACTLSRGLDKITGVRTHSHSPTHVSVNINLALCDWEDVNVQITQLITKANDWSKFDNIVIENVDRLGSSS